jgi:SAM-dependent methyltransferase
MSLNCTTDKYDDLYAPWLQKPDSLLRLAKYDPETDSLVDLCGGTGAVSKAATVLATHRSVENPIIDLVDLNPRLLTDPWVVPYVGAAENLDSILPPRSRTLVVCRQAMGYLDPEQVIPAVGYVLKPGGRFVFSTFKQPRPYRIKRYTYQGERYMEFHVSAFGKVLHLQKKYGPYGGSDWSLFKYHRVSYLHQLLCSLFLVDFQEVGRSYRWVCTRRLIPEG